MADLVGGMTERWLIEAGIAPGMRVLDVGCGRGDVSLLVARLVGAEGDVVGVDLDPGGLAVARKRAAEAGGAKVTFVEGDFGALAVAHGPFDAAVGRRVLMYQPDRVDAVRRLVEALRPGGLIFFHEHDGTMPPGRLTALPLHEQVREWVWQTVEREGATRHMGFELASVLEQAGLTGVALRAEAIVQTPTTPYHTGMIVRAMMPRIVAKGVATAEEIDVDTLDARLAEERKKANATYVGEMVFGAWGRKPV